MSSQIAIGSSIHRHPLTLTTDEKIDKDDDELMREAANVLSEMDVVKNGKTWGLDQSNREVLEEIKALKDKKSFRLATWCDIADKLNGYVQKLYNLNSVQGQKPPPILTESLEFCKRNIQVLELDVKGNLPLRKELGMIHRRADKNLSSGVIDGSKLFREFLRDFNRLQDLLMKNAEIKIYFPLSSSAR
jgi:hypothetical protein